MCNAPVTRSGVNQRASEIAAAQPAQGEVGGTEVINSRLQVRQVAANHIQLEFIERAGAGRRAKVNFFAGMPLDLGDAGREVENACKIPQSRDGFGIPARKRPGNCGQRGDTRLVYVSRQRDGIQRVVHLVR